MLISVVITIFNKAPYIERAINSILNQSYQDFEIIIIDDGSTDKGANIVESIHDTRIRFFQQRNLGVSYARNKGVNESKSDFIAFLDADDKWDENTLLTFYNLINQYPNCVLYGQSYQIIDKKVIIPISLKKYPFKWTGYLDSYLSLAALSQPFCSSSVCITKNAFLEAGGFPINVNIGEDLSLWLTLFYQGKFAFCHSLNCSYYFDNSDNVSKESTHEFEFFENQIENKIMNFPQDSKDWSDLYEYFSSIELVICVNKLRLGKPKECRQKLSKIRNTKMFRNRRLKILLLSYLPSSLFRLIYRLFA